MIQTTLARVDFHGRRYAGMSGSINSRCPPTFSQQQTSHDSQLAQSHAPLSVANTSAQENCPRDRLGVGVSRCQPGNDRTDSTDLFDGLVRDVHHDHWLHPFTDLL